MSFDLNTLDPKKVTFAAIASPGVRFTNKREIVKIEQIYVPIINDSKNKVRIKSKNISHIQKLVRGLSNGINYSKCPPIVRKKTQIVNGIQYDYELVCGNHRLEAFHALGYDRWIFDVYEICLDGYSYDDCVTTLQLQENDHDAELSSTSDDITNAIIYMISQGSKLVEATDSSVDNYIENYLPNIHWNTKGKIIRQVVAACGLYQDVITYTPKDLNDWISNSVYKNEGEYDKRLKKHGWTCRTRYEPDTIFSMLKKLHETGKESYVICHTSAPTGSVTLDDKRKAVLNNFETWEEIFTTMIEFYNETGRFPWTLEGFLPQDCKLPEDKTSLVSVASIVKKSLPALKVLKAAKKKST
jgi:hypothetical protein